MGLVKKIRIGSDADREFGAVSIPFGKLDSTSTETVMTATVDNFPTTLSDGVCAYIVNGVVSSASGFTLNINNTGALPVYQTQAAQSRASTVFNVNHTYLFVYNSSRVDGGCWDIYYGYSNSLAYQVRTNSMRKAMTDKCYRYRILFSSADDTKYVPANTSTSTNATASRSACQTKINPWGDIRYYSATTALSAGDKPAATSLYEQYSITLGYSFNTTGAALTLTSWKPVYVKCAPQTDGSAIIDSTTPYVQDLPSSDDGKIYIFLGVAHSATAIELLPYHPVYYYKDSAIRIWTNTALPATDSTPTSGSTNLVTSGGVYAAIPRNTSDLTNDSGFITGMTILSYGTSTWQNFLDAYTANRVIYCRASANTNPATGDQLRMAFMAYIGGSATMPTSVEFQYYRSVSSHSDSQQGDQVFIYKLDSNGWTVTVREAYTKIVASTGLSSSYSNGVKTITAPNDASPTSGSTKLVQSGGVYTALSGKADKVSSATSGNFAALDANGNLTDSGHKHSDYQATLVSGTSIKTINNTSLLGSGNISVVTDVSGKEDTSNKVTSLSSSSTDTQYPSAKCVYDIIGDVETLINAL